MTLIEQNIDTIKSLCGKHKVSKLFAFGSVLTDKFNKQSDVDFVVDFKDVSLNEYADNYFDLKFSLEDVLNRNIDLLEEKAISNPFLKKSIDSSKQLVYG